jgi:hypothetical protein
MRTNETSGAVFREGLTDTKPGSLSAQIVTIASLTADGTALVRLGASSSAVPARFAFRATRERVETAIVLHQQAVVLFENGDPSRPLIVGFIEALEPQSPLPLVEADEPARDASDETRDLQEVEAKQPDASDRMPFVEADVDGKRVRVTAQDEIVLQCGSASVTLRRNGRVVIRGTYVETHSEGTNRIKGGQVQIN